MDVIHKYNNQNWYICPIGKLNMSEWDLLRIGIERQRWCKDNIGPRGKLWRFKFLRPNRYNQRLICRVAGYYPHNYYMMFADRNDLTLYRLRWG